MAIVQCKECGADISSQAKACPKCGAPTSTPKHGLRLDRLLIFLLVPVVVAGIVASQQSADEARANAKSPAERAADAKKEAEFRRAVRMAMLVKQGLKNPASFELSDAILTDAGALCLVYRATNSFNAMVPGYAVLTPDEKVAIGRPDDVRSIWNKHCGSKSGTDMLYIRNAL